MVLPQCVYKILIDTYKMRNNHGPTTWVSIWSRIYHLTEQMSRPMKGLLLAKQAGALTIEQPCIHKLVYTCSYANRVLKPALISIVSQLFQKYNFTKTRSL